MSEGARAEGADTGSGGEVPPRVRPALDARPLATWWVVFAGLVLGLLFILTDHVLRATLCIGGALLLAALVRVTLPGSKVGGIAVRGPLIDVITLVVLGSAVLVAGFTLDLTAR